MGSCRKCFACSMAYSCRCRTRYACISEKTTSTHQYLCVKYPVISVSSLQHIPHQKRNLRRNIGTCIYRFGHERTVDFLHDVFCGTFNCAVGNQLEKITERKF